MKILFLDIDGVVNCSRTKQRHRGFIGIDPVKAAEIRRIVAETGCEVVLSSTWRIRDDDRDAVRRQVCSFIDVTPNTFGGHRGTEIDRWLELHPEVKRYAIVDDDTDILTTQAPNWFRTYYEGEGITTQLADAIIAHFSDAAGSSGSLC